MNSKSSKSNKPAKVLSRKKPSIKRAEVAKGPRKAPAPSLSTTPTYKSALPAAVLKVLPKAEANQIEDLAESIRRCGQLVPIVADEKGRIIDGRKRLEACALVGVKPNIVKVKKGTDASQRYSDLTLRRDHWNNGQRALIGAAMSNLGVGVNQHTMGKGITQGDAAKLLHTSTDSIGRAKVLLESGRQDLVEQVAQKGGSLPQALRILQNDEIIQKNRKALGKDTVHATKAFADMINKGARYSVVYADPPWNYRGSKGSPQDPGLNYPTMAVAKIMAMNVKGLAAKDAVCLLWVPNSLIPEGLNVLKAWGFEYSTCRVWCKPNGGPMSKSLALPHHETLLIGRRGAGVPIAKRCKVPKSYLVEALDKRKHSKKPATFAEQIDEAYPSAAKIELFCRQPRKGWTAWGNQAKGKKEAKGKKVAKTK